MAITPFLLFPPLSPPKKKKTSQDSGHNSNFVSLSTSALASPLAGCRCMGRRVGKSPLRNSAPPTAPSLPRAEYCTPHATASDWTWIYHRGALRALQVTNERGGEVSKDIAQGIGDGRMVLGRKRVKRPRWFWVSSILLFGIAWFMPLSYRLFMLEKSCYRLPSVLYWVVKRFVDSLCMIIAC